MWDLIVSVPDHCLSFYFEDGIMEHLCKDMSLKLVEIQCIFLYYHAILVRCVSGMQALILASYVYYL